MKDLFLGLGAGSSYPVIELSSYRVIQPSLSLRGAEAASRSCEQSEAGVKQVATRQQQQKPIIY
jgi:hypothetical protein